MHAVLKKLQLEDQSDLLVVSAPKEFKPILAGLGKSFTIATDWRGKRRRGFVLVFVKACDEIPGQAAKAVERLEDDGLLWFAYPKKSSKRYDSDIGRDDSWAALGKFGFEGVRMIAIDEDWSALRFREVDRIKTFRRSASGALSAKGKKRAAKRR